MGLGGEDSQQEALQSPVRGHAQRQRVRTVDEGPVVLPQETASQLGEEAVGETPLVQGSGHRQVTRGQVVHFAPALWRRIYGHCTTSYDKQ